MPVKGPVPAFDLELVSSQLPPGPPAWTIRWLPEVGSTQDLVREAALNGAGEGWTVVTDWQREGRGRLGRQWTTPAGRDLLFSVLLRPGRPLLSLLPLLAGVAIVDGLRLVTGLPVELKWPNDLLLGRHKLAGILLEHGPDDATALGVGVNVNSALAELPPQAASISAALGRKVRREPLLAAILLSLKRGLDRAREEGQAWVIPAWREHSSMLGRPITYEQDGVSRSAVAEDLEEDGALRVLRDDGSQTRIYAGDVRLLRN